jgi:leucyl-tRNA synthetase
VGEGAVVPLDAAALSPAARALRRQLHEAIQKVGDDYARRYTFNTAIAAVMELLNALSKYDEASPTPARCARKPSRRSCCCSTRSRRTARTRCGRAGPAEATLEDLPSRRPTRPRWCATR